MQATLLFKKRIKESKVHGPNIQAEGIVGINLNAGYSNMEETVRNKVIEPGFSKLPPQKVTSYRPPNCKDEESVYVTIKHTDIEGNEFILCENSPRG